MSEQVMIQVRFTEQTKYGEYSDALYFTQEDYASKTEEDILLLKQERINNWINVVTNPPVDEEQ